MEKETVIEQTKLAFSLIQKLYFEVALLIQEIEGMLGDEDERFVIGKVGGYAISARRSTGLERFNVPLWMVRKLAVFFVPEESTKYEAGMTNTTITPKLKMIFLRIVLDDKDYANQDSMPEYCIILLQNRIRNLNSQWQLLMQKIPS